jgi:flagellar biosynthesis protein FlhB
MAEDEQDQRTEHPTGKRLGEARERGQLPISREVISWASFAAIFLVILWLGPNAAREMPPILIGFLESPHMLSLDDQNIQTIIFDSVGHVAMATGLIFILMAAAVILSTIWQTGLFASLQLITPDLGRLSITNGIKKLFSLNNLVEFGKAFGKLLVLGPTAFFILRPVINELPTLTGLSFDVAMNFLHHEAVRLTIILLLIFSIIAAADYFYQNYAYIKNLRMTKAEVKDEYRQQEGDPMIKSRLRQIRLEKARKRMMAQVPKADVVITNPTHYAVALAYDNKTMTAPTVLAKGINETALRIRELAEEHRIALVSNPPLSRALYDTVEIDEQIPTQHYRAVAEIISYVYKLKKRKF